MRTAFRRIDIIDKTIGALRVGIVVLHGDLDINVVLLALKIEHILIQRRLAPVQVSHKLLDAALVMKYLLHGPVLRAQVAQDDLQVFCQKRHFPETLFQHVIVKYCLLKNSLIREKCDLCPGLVRFTFAGYLERIAYISPLIPLVIDLSLGIDINLKPLGERVHDRCTHTVQPA